jgi:adenylate kinase
MIEKNDRSTWLKGGDACCSVPPQKSAKPYRFILLGAPGVGKGTQAELLCARLGTCHLSTGDVFRAAKCLACGERSPALDAAMDFMRRGDLVPDTTVLDIVRERKRCLNCHGGFLLDGFPRTVPQAEALMSLLEKEEIPLTAVINYEMPISEIVTRLAGRRTCGGCKAVYHVINRPPKVEGICDQCGGQLIQREDDRPEAVRLRMEVYEQSTRPLIDYFNRHSLLISVAAQGKPEDIYQRTIATLNSVTLTDRISA